MKNSDVGLLKLKKGQHPHILLAEGKWREVDDRGVTWNGQGIVREFHLVKGGVGVFNMTGSYLIEILSDREAILPYLRATFPRATLDV